VSSFRRTRPTGATITVRATRIDVTPNQTAEAVIQATLVALAPSMSPVSACPEVSNLGNNFDSAALILVDRAGRHGICIIGDENWFRFGAVAGKCYSIDIPDIDTGLDLSLELYDSNWRLVDS
jgi:predicted N-acetyltransferase YhbS